MVRADITALAKGLVPFVREIVEPLERRIAELEARPTEKGDAGDAGPQGEIGPLGPEGPAGPKGDSGELALLPPELAEQVASAVRMLHEAPAIPDDQDR